MRRTDHAAARRRMVEAHRKSGEIHDERVLEAMGRVPREEFVPPALRNRAYEDCALPIAADQSISQPYVVALMTQALALRGDERVLEIGTGSGYQLAVLRELAQHVTSVERIPELAVAARRTLAAIGIDDAEIHVGDGSLGWPDGAPYDAIVVTAGAPAAPPALLEQLAVGGRLVLPVGPRGMERLLRIVRQPDGELTRTDLGAVAFVPLVGREGW